MATARYFDAATYDQRQQVDTHAYAIANAMQAELEDLAAKRQALLMEAIHTLGAQLARDVPQSAMQLRGEVSVLRQDIARIEANTKKNISALAEENKLLRWMLAASVVLGVAIIGLLFWEGLQLHGLVSQSLPPA